MRLFDKKYEKIKSLISDILIDYEINELPIDVFKLAEKMKIEVVKYSNFKSEEAIVLLNGSEDGMSFYDNDLKHFVIFYNDSKPEYRIRFTISHEIGHIVLGHKESSEENESEADFFARQLLVPTCILLHENICDVSTIIKKFNVSLQVALISIENVLKRIQYGHETLTCYEVDLLKHFNLYKEDKDDSKK